jgi:hypothetical protein
MTPFRIASRAATFSSVDGHLPPFLRPALGRYPPRVGRFTVLKLWSDIDIHKSKKSKGGCGSGGDVFRRTADGMIQYEGK